MFGLEINIIHKIISSFIIRFSHLNSINAKPRAKQIVESLYYEVIHNMLYL